MKKEADFKPLTSRSSGKYTTTAVLLALPMSYLNEWLKLSAADVLRLGIHRNRI